MTIKTTRRCNSFHILHDNGLKTIQGERTILLQKMKPFHDCVYAILTEVKDIILTQECQQEVRGLIKWENKSKFLYEEYFRDRNVKDSTQDIQIIYIFSGKHTTFLLQKLEYQPPFCNIYLKFILREALFLTIILNPSKLKN